MFSSIQHKKIEQRVNGKLMRPTRKRAVAFVTVRTDIIAIDYCHTLNCASCAGINHSVATLDHARTAPAR